MTTLPFGIGCIVEYQDGPEMDSFFDGKLTGKKLLVDTVRCLSIEEDHVEAKYVLAGHLDLGSKGRGGGWVRHDRLKLVSEPTVDSWRMLMEANDADEDGDDDLDDDDLDDEDDDYEDDAADEEADRFDEEADRFDEEADRFDEEADRFDEEADRFDATRKRIVDEEADD